MATKVFMEALSPTMEEGRLVKWLKNEGDAIKNGDVLAEVETDKAIMELVARGEGILRKRLIEEGATTPVSTLIGIIAGADENIDSLLAGAGAQAPTQPAPAQPAAAPARAAEEPKAQQPEPSPAAPAAAGAALSGRHRPPLPHPPPTAGGLGPLPSHAASPANGAWIWGASRVPAPAAASSRRTWKPPPPPLPREQLARDRPRRRRSQTHRRAPHANPQDHRAAAR
jgi:pyruvate/2-oxoglutarate dehydrogenase complex dihydrolipoamide acyltransferase (E2) component